MTRSARLVVGGALVAAALAVVLPTWLGGGPEPVPGTAKPEYAFLRVDRDTGRPVGWDRCRPIHLVVNIAGAPPQWDDLLRQATAAVREASGLKFVIDGLTDDRDFLARSRDVGGPVLVGWAPASELPQVAEDAGGFGRPVEREVGGVPRYVGGTVVLNGDLSSRWAGQSQPDPIEIAQLMHVLGHLVGLDDVSSDDELMSGSGLHQLLYGPGDLAGLRRLGQLPCAGDD